MKATKRDTAGGPDMIRLPDVKKVGHEHLASIFKKMVGRWDTDGRKSKQNNIVTQRW